MTGFLVKAEHINQQERKLIPSIVEVAVPTENFIASAEDLPALPGWF